MTLALEPLRTVALAGIANGHSRRACGRGISDFTAWYAERRADLGPVSKAVVGAYSEWLQARGLSASTVAQRLSAVRRLFLEAADAGAVDPQLAQAIGRIKGPKNLGRRLGKWLTLDEARAVVLRPLDGIERTPPLERLKRRRDHAILAVLIGCGLRRAECAGLKWAQIQQRDGRWVICDLVGKGGRVRSVPVPTWVMTALEGLREQVASFGRRDGQNKNQESEVLQGLVRAVFPSLNHGVIQRTAVSAEGIAAVVEHWSRVAGTPLAAHDLRRTHAKLARRSGCDLEQLQYALGHASVVTTQRYVGDNQQLDKGPGDFIEL